LTDFKLNISNVQAVYMLHVYVNQDCQGSCTAWGVML